MNGGDDLIGARRLLDDAALAARTALNALDDLLDTLESAASWSALRAVDAAGDTASGAEQQRLGEAAALHGRVAGALHLLVASVAAAPEFLGVLGRTSLEARFGEVGAGALAGGSGTSTRIEAAVTALQGIQETVGAAGHELTRRRDEIDRELTSASLTHEH